jgi:hypothetical protein
MTSLTWSRSLMLPGLRRILCTPASTASSARLKWKWTSATIGTVVWFRISGEGLGVLLLGDGDADDVRPGRGELVDLRDALVDVVRVAGGHGLDGDGRGPTARSSREIELLMTQINECWVRVLDAEVMAAEQDTTQEKAVEVASSARLLAESIERGASPKELRQIFGELEASLSNIARADGDGPESGQTEGAAGEAA